MRPNFGAFTGLTGVSLGGEIGLNVGLATGFNLGIQCSKSARNVTLYNTHAKECRKGARLVIHTIIVYVTRCPDMSGFRNRSYIKKRLRRDYYDERAVSRHNAVRKPK